MNRRQTRRNPRRMTSALPPDIVLTADQVRERFRWAKRQGNPAWLWPSIAFEEWREALGAVERIVRARLSNSAIDERLDGNADAIGLAGYTSGVGPLLGSRLPLPWPPS
jgi:hypothetical protein